MFCLVFFFIIRMLIIKYFYNCPTNVSGHKYYRTSEFTPRDLFGQIKFLTTRVERVTLTYCRVCSKFHIDLSLFLYVSQPRELTNSIDSYAKPALLSWLQVTVGMTIDWNIIGMNISIDEVQRKAAFTTAKWIQQVIHFPCFFVGIYSKSRGGFHLYMLSGCCLSSNNHEVFSQHL